MLVDMPRNIFEDIDIQRDRIRGLEKFLQLGYSYLKHYMAEDILVKIDRATMFNSLEVRSPFLDTNLAEYVFSLPVNLKLHGFKTKYILKRLMTGHLGADVVNRSKQGFSIPLARWLANDLRDIVAQNLNRERIVRDGIFNPDYIERLIDEHVKGHCDHRKRIWTLLTFQLWKESNFH